MKLHTCTNNKVSPNPLVPYVPYLVT